MKLRPIRHDENGSTATEFGLTAPLFFMILWGIIECGLLLWTQLGLQHGTEMAVRCAAVNKTICGTTPAIQNFAAQQAYGLNPSPSTFSVSTAACGTQVTAAYSFNFIVTYFGVSGLSLSAGACFPT